MSSVLFQNGLNSAAYVIALIVLILAIALGILLFVRSSAQRREREGRVRERMLEMEREAQFAGAADRVPISRSPWVVAREVERLLRDYLSIPVLAVYAGCGTNAALSDVLRTEGTDAIVAPGAGLPVSISGSLVADYPRPTFVRLALFADQEPGDPPVAEKPVAGQNLTPVEEYSSAEKVESAEKVDELAAAQSDQHQEKTDDAETEDRQTEIESVDPVSTSPGVDLAMLLPWRGPFEWNGVIVVSASPGITPEVLEPYREPLARLTDRVAVALEFERSDAASEASDQRAARTTDFSRSLISCLDEASPLEAIVREVARLVRSDSAALWRVDEASGMVRMVAAHGLRSPEFLPLPVGQGLAGSVAESGRVLAIEEAPADPRCIFPREARESGIVSYLAAPLAANNKALGVIEVHCSNRRPWTDGDQQSIESAATIIAELVKSTDSRGNRLRVEGAYLGLSESLQQLRSADEVKEAVVEVLGHALAASRVIVVEFNDQNRPEAVKHEYRQSAVKSALGATFGEALAAGVASANVGGQPIAISDSHQQSLVGAKTANDLGVLSELAAPMRVEGKTKAIVYVHQCDRVREWEHDEIEFAERVVRQLSLSLSNLTSLQDTANEAEQAREEARRAVEISNDAPQRIEELEKKLETVERALAQSKSMEQQARGMLGKTSGFEAKARAEAEGSRQAETEVRKQLEHLQEQHKQTQGSAQQLLEINRLKSEFIVNAGREMEASLQSVLGLAELLERGSYGSLTAEQREVVHGIYGWARRIKSDIDWLVEYGSARSRRLESSGGS